MGPKKKRKGIEDEDEGGRGKRAKKPSSKWAMLGKGLSTMHIFILFIKRKTIFLLKSCPKELPLTKLTKRKPKKRLTAMAFFILMLVWPARILNPNKINRTR